MIEIERRMYLKNILGCLGFILVIILLLGACGAMFENDCDKPLLDYNGNGKTFDVQDYDTMKSLEESCN